MAHRTSAAALHAARVVLRDYELAVKPPEVLSSGRIPNLEANEAHLSIIIDLASGIHNIAELRPELRYWQKRVHAGDAPAPQLAGFLQRILDAFDKLPRDDPRDAEAAVAVATMPEFRSGAQRLVLSKSAKDAARYVFHYYDVRPKNGTARLELDCVEVAKLIELGTRVGTALQAVPVARRWLDRLKAGTATEDDIKGCLRKVGVLFEHLSHYENREEESKILV